MIPTIPAVMNAIYDAVGVRMTSLPATPEKIIEAIKAKARAAQTRVAAE
jgi:CO/xanthine dehydrogenase Mo-binding subunit